jgi:hypothetical protein
MKLKSKKLKLSKTKNPVSKVTIDLTKGNLANISKVVIKTPSGKFELLYSELLNLLSNLKQQNSDTNSNNPFVDVNLSYINNFSDTITDEEIKDKNTLFVANLFKKQLENLEIPQKDEKDEKDPYLNLINDSYDTLYNKIYNTSEPLNGTLLSNLTNVKDIKVEAHYPEQYYMPRDLPKEVKTIIDTYKKDIIFNYDENAPIPTLSQDILETELKDLENFREAIRKTPKELEDEAFRNFTKADLPIYLKLFENDFNEQVSNTHTSNNTDKPNINFITSEEYNTFVNNQRGWEKKDPNREFNHHFLMNSPVIISDTQFQVTDWNPLNRVKKGVLCDSIDIWCLLYENGTFYCNTVTEDMSKIESPVLDIIAGPDWLIFLLKNGQLYIESWGLQNFEELINIKESVKSISYNAQSSYIAMVTNKGIHFIGLYNTVAQLTIESGYDTTEFNTNLKEFIRNLTKLKELITKPANTVIALDKGFVIDQRGLWLGYSVEPLNYFGILNTLLLDIKPSDFIEDIVIIDNNPIIYLRDNWTLEKKILYYSFVLKNSSETYTTVNPYNSQSNTEIWFKPLFVKITELEKLITENEDRSFKLPNNPILHIFKNIQKDGVHTPKDFDIFTKSNRGLRNLLGYNGTVYMIYPNNVITNKFNQTEFILKRLVK